VAYVGGSPFDLKDSQFKSEQWSSWQDVANWLAIELDQALSARGGAATEIKYNWDYYEQNRMRGSNAPWPDAADLPSPLAPEYTDAVHARLLQTIFVEPVWTVEGYGPSAKHAPFVEEFHQRAQEDERLQTYLDEWMLRGLIEGVGTLEVCEAYEYRRTVNRRRVQLQLDETTGQPVMGEDAQPMLARHPETGDYVDAEDDQQPSAEVDVDQAEPVRLGPDYDVIPYLEFGMLPAHARNNKQVWGSWKRFARRIPQLKACAARGIYDADAIARLGTADESSNNTETAPHVPPPVPQEGMTAQKDLFEVRVLADFDGAGERWWCLTLHKETRTLLRGQKDDRTTRYIRWMPFPKPGSVDRGYSLIGNKLITVIEEDTARRNMTADRMALKIATPILRRQGALWDPYEQPFGPKAVIDVRDPNELVPMQGIEDVPASVMIWRQHLRDDADRLIGQNDVSLGVGTQDAQKPTATQVNATAGYAEVRMNVLIRRMQEALEELFQARHTIWLRTLKSNPHLPLQRAMVIGRDQPGIDVSQYPEDGRLTASMLEGTFWGKPRGSVESADLNRQQTNLMQMMQSLGPIMQINPAIRQVLSTVPAAKAFLEQVLRVYRWPDTQSFLGSEANDVFDVLQQQQEQQQQEQQLLSDPRMRIAMAMAGGAPPGAAPAGPMAPPPAATGQPPTGGGLVS